MTNPLADLAAVAHALDHRGAVYNVVVDPDPAVPVVFVYRGTWNPPLHRRPTDPIYHLTRTHQSKETP